jgi:archaellum biogenesis ATPase FlaH
VRRHAALHEERSHRAVATEGTILDFLKQIHS